MTRLLIDTSVVIKWFHSEGESELAEAHAIRRAHVVGEVDAHILDLAIYEVGNVLLRALRWNAFDTSGQLADLLAVVGTPLVMSTSWLPDAASLADIHGLSFYDASWAAAARGLGMTLVSADRKLLGCGLAEAATDTIRRLKLPS